jgi:hypothetical protein
MILFKNIPGICLLVCLIFGCKHAPDISYTPKKTCDTASVSYSRDVLPVLQQYCYDCHAGSAAINGFDFTVFANIQLLALDSTEHYLPDVLFKANLRMPPAPLPLVDSCSIHKISAWVNQGARNN